MPERFRDPSTGRWVSREAAAARPTDFIREFFGQRPPPPPPEAPPEPEPEPRPEPNWTERYTQWAVIWEAQDEGEDEGEDEGKGKGASLDVYALQEASPPYGTTSFQLRFRMPAGDPRYSRGWASSSWLFNTEWPPSPEDIPPGALGIGAVVFERRQ